MEEIDQTGDHRTRVGAIRRENTRTRLIETALSVFAAKGPDAPLIEDFIAAAGVARGTFYNYFRTTEELLAAVAGEISDEILGVIDPMIVTIDDPALRVAIGARLYMRMGLRYPLWGTFISRVGMRRGARGRLLDETVTRDLELGMAAGRFRIESVQVARDVVLGSITYGIETIASGQGGADYDEQSMFAILQALGVGRREARSLAHTELPEVAGPRGTIFSRIESGNAT